MQRTPWKLPSGSYTMEITSCNLNHVGYLTEVTPWKLSSGNYTMVVTSWNLHHESYLM